jgi:hypothetical protein
MDKEQTTAIIVLLAAILFVLLVGRVAAAELLGNLFWVAVPILIVAVIALAVKNVFASLLASSRARKERKLRDEIEQLCLEISTFPGVRLTSEHIPQRFPSKAAAQAFAERWSRGGPDSFKAKAVDAQLCDEDHPRFNVTSFGRHPLRLSCTLLWDARSTQR